MMHARSWTNTDPVMVPRIAKEAYKKSKLLGRLKKGKDDMPKIVELMGKASVLGMVTYERDQDFLIVYDSQRLTFSAYMFVV